MQMLTHRFSGWKFNTAKIEGEPHRTRSVTYEPNQGATAFILLPA